MAISFCSFASGSSGNCYMPLSDEQMKKFEEDAGKLLSKKVKLHNEIDKTIIGGVRLLVDGKQIDASLRSRLDELRRRYRKCDIDR